MRVRVLGLLPALTRLARLILATLLTFSLPAAAAPAQKCALLIGLNRYAFGRAERIPALRYAEDDARDMAAAFRALGYEPKVLLANDAERADIVLALTDYAAMLGEDDTFVLFFAGHGMRSANGRAYWLAHDTAPTFVDDKGIRLEHLLDYVQDIKAKRKLVLLDHCFSGDAGEALRRSRDLDVTSTPATPADTARTTTSPAAFGRGVVRVGDIKDTFREQIQGRAKGLILLAAARDEAFESPTLKHGIFTSALLEALTTRKASTDDRLSAAELLEFAKQQVKELAKSVSSGEQHMSDVVEGSDIAEWEIGQPPPGNALDAEQRKETYINEIVRFYDRGWGFQQDLRFRCLGVLEKWLKSFTGGPALTPGEEKIRDEIAKHVDQPGGCEELCAKDLETVLRRVLR